MIIAVNSRKKESTNLERSIQNNQRNNSQNKEQDFQFYTMLKERNIDGIPKEIDKTIQQPIIEKTIKKASKYSYSKVNIAELAQVSDNEHKMIFMDYPLFQENNTDEIITEEQIRVRYTQICDEMERSSIEERRKNYIFFYNEITTLEPKDRNRIYNLLCRKPRKFIKYTNTDDINKKLEEYKHVQNNIEENEEEIGFYEIGSLLDDDMDSEIPKKEKSNDLTTNNTNKNSELEKFIRTSYDIDNDEEIYKKENLKSEETIEN